MEEMQRGIKQDRKGGKKEYADNLDYVDGKLSEAIHEIKKKAKQVELKTSQSLQLQEEYVKTLEGESMGHLLPKKKQEITQPEVISSFFDDLTIARYKVNEDAKALEEDPEV